MHTNARNYLVIVAMAFAVPARAGVLHDLASDVAAKLDAIRAAHAVPPAPVPVAVKWKPIRIASEELGAPLVALVAGDLRGDGRDELYAVTTREVVAFGFAAHRLKELGRVTFVGEPAVPASRDPVGAAVIAGRVLFASSSAYAHGVKVSWHGKQLVAELGDTGMELCAGEHAVLVPGRDYFGDDKNGYYGVRCRELADHAGTPQRARALLGMTGKLEITVDAAHYTFPKVGTAFELADLDRDGKPELVYASASAPGEPDELRAVTLGEDENKTKWKKAFTAGGVAGIAVGDFDGAPAAIAAVRLVGSTRVDVWRLN
ncbi:MAG: hypothetical protein ABI591_30550 [Kofleriaceae bacterium]